MERIENNPRKRRQQSTSNTYIPQKTARSYQTIGDHNRKSHTPRHSTLPPLNSKDDIQGTETTESCHQLPSSFESIISLSQKDQRYTLTTESSKRKQNMSSSSQLYVRKNKNDFSDSDVKCYPKQMPCPGPLEFPLGIRNIGNTCFVNSVIQILRQTPYILRDLENKGAFFRNTSYDTVTTTSLRKKTSCSNPSEIQMMDEINDLSLTLKARPTMRMHSSNPASKLPEIKVTKDSHGTLTTEAAKQNQGLGPSVFVSTSGLRDTLISVLKQKASGQETATAIKRLLSITSASDPIYRFGNQNDSHLFLLSLLRVADITEGVTINNFNIEFSNTFHCKECNHRIEYKTQVMKSIPIAGGFKTVKCGIKDLCAKKVHSGENYRCRNRESHISNNRYEVQLQMRLTRLPPVLVIALNRVKAKEHLGRLDQTKDSSFIRYEEELILEEKGEIPKTMQYKLYGVINHHGSTFSGHYTAYVKKRGSYKWFRCNDGLVEEIPKEKVLNSTDAYVLFYLESSMS